MNVRVHLESMCSLQVLSVTAICSCQLSIDGKYCSTIICQYFSNPLRLLLMLCLFVMSTNDQRAWTYSTIIVYFSNPSLVLLVVHVLLLLLLHSSSVRLLVLLDKFILVSTWNVMWWNAFCAPHFEFYSVWSPLDTSTLLWLVFALILLLLLSTCPWLYIKLCFL